MSQPAKREVKYKDPNMYHEAVLFYRETFDKCPNAGFRRDIVKTVQTYQDLLLWQNILANWKWYDKVKRKWRKKNPLAIKAMLDDLDTLIFNREKVKRDNQTSSLSTCSRERLSTGSDRDVSKVRSEPPSIYFRTS